jgi:hypothetical protein
MIALIAAASLSIAPCHPQRFAKRRRAECTTSARKDPAIVAERMLRRRVVRMARIAYFEREQTLLSEFIARAATEQTLFRDDRRLRFGQVEIGPVIVTRDFLGSPVLRARIHNERAAPLGVLLTARLNGAGGQTCEATTAAQLRADGAAQTVELSCARATNPISVEWTVTNL